MRCSNGNSADARDKPFEHNSNILIIPAQVSSCTPELESVHPMPRLWRPLPGGALY